MVLLAVVALPNTSSRVWTRPPSIVGPWVRARATQHACVAIGGQAAAHGTEKRRREFAVGRECATQALIDAGAREVTVGVGCDRAPLWPSGFVGSITHSNTFAWAAVAKSTDLRSIGVDSEPLFDDDALSEALPLALDEAERARLTGECFRELGTVAFSAKESLYKCLNPCSGVFFDFADALLEWIATDGDGGGTFGLRLRRNLGDVFPGGMRISGRYAVGTGHVHTAIELLP
jgi:enterobactin synthetase component D